MIFTNTNTYTGGTTLERRHAATGRRPNNNGSVTGNISDNATLVFAPMPQRNRGGAITGSGGVIAAGPGTITLSGNNGYAGGTTVERRRAGHGQRRALGSGGLTLAGGTLSGSGNPTLTLTGGPIDARKRRGQRRTSPAAWDSTRPPAAPSCALRQQQL